MSDFLTAVKTVTLRQRPQPEESHLDEVGPVKPLVQTERAALKSPDNVLELLRSRPDTDALEDVLIYLSKRQTRDGFNIRVPSPSAAKIINELISTTIPNFWDGIDGLKTLLLDTLRSVAGIGAIVARLRLLTSSSKVANQAAQTSDSTHSVLQLASVLSQLLTSDDTTFRVLADIRRLVDNQVKQDLLWKEYLVSVASGRIIAVVAQAEDVTNTTVIIKEKSWLSDGHKYSAWLGRNVAYMVRRLARPPDKFDINAAAQMCGKAFNIGYAGRYPSRPIPGPKLSIRYFQVEW